MTVRLVQIAADADPALMARALAPAFGGDEASARELLEQTLTLLAGTPRPRPWGAYLAEVENAAIGTCAFKAAPNDRGEVEIAYMTFPAFEGRGHANAMVAALTEIAESAGARPIARTLREENASNHALRRNAYLFGGEVEDPEDGLVWRWERPR